MSIVIENLSYIYDKGTPNETRALDDINLTIERGEFVGLIGHTGSGKSTLVQQLNGLLKPSEGKISVGDVELTNPETKLIEVRKRVGLVFQYPEYQLFEETIEKDIAFGPKNLGLNDAEQNERVKYSMELVGLDYQELKDKSPFELSGGQKRRVAIAGVIAMKPEVLILDEPTAGLDPHGRDEILSQIKKLHGEEEMTVIIVSHSMEDMAKISNRLMVMNKGKIVLDGPPKEVFKEIDLLEEIGLAVPQISYIVRGLIEKGIEIDDEIITVEEAAKCILKMLGEKNA